MMCGAGVRVYVCCVALLSLSAFVEGFSFAPLALRSSRARMGSAIRMAEHGNHENIHVVSRRKAMLSLTFLGSIIILPMVSSAAPLSAEEEEEYAKLLQEAKRIQGLFDDMKTANSDLAGLPKLSKEPAPTPLANADKPSSKLTAEEVASKIFTALKNNNNPAPNNGLKVTLEYSSPLNPVKNQPFERFAQVMEGGKYSILLGKFDKFSVLPAGESSRDADAIISLVDVKVTAPPEIFIQSRMPDDYLEEVGDGRSKAVTFRLQLRRGPETNDCWLSDTLYLLTPPPRA